MHQIRLKTDSGHWGALAAIAAMAVATTLSSPAQAASGYLSLGVGLSNLLSEKISSCARHIDDLSQITCFTPTKSDPAPFATIAGGLLFGHFSFELAYTNRRTVLRDSSSASALYGLQLHELFANSYFHFALGSRLRPYIGFGLGYGDFRIKQNATGARADGSLMSPFDATYDDSLFGYQGLLGVDFLLSPNSMIGLGARFTSFSDSDVVPTLWSTDPNPELVALFTSSFKDLDFYSITLDYSYRFDAGSSQSLKNKWISRPDNPERDRFGFYIQTALPYMYATGQLDASQQVGNTASGLSFGGLGGTLGTGIGIGMHWGALRLEVSYDFRQYTSREPSVQIGCTHCITNLGDYTVQEYMALLYWDFKPWVWGNTLLVPYLGAGFGVADTELSFLAIGLDAGSANGSGTDDDAVATARLSAGLSYPIDERVHIALETRFSWYDNSNFAGNGFSLALEEQFHFGTAAVLRLSVLRPPVAEDKGNRTPLCQW